MATRRCPVCATQFEPEERPSTMPFCSERCRRIDLHRWLSEKYALPIDPLAEDEERHGSDPQQDAPTDGPSGRN